MKTTPPSCRALLSRFLSRLLSTLGFAALLLMIAGSAGGQIFVSNTNNTIAQFATGGSGSTFASGGSLSSPNGLAFDSAGNLYVSNGNNSKIVKFTGSTPSDFITANVSTPQGMAFDSSGNLYVANYFAGTISKFNSSGEFDSTFATGLGYPTGLAFDTTGHLYVATTDDSATIPKIVKFTGTTPSNIITSTLYLNQPKGLAFDGAGNLYVANAGSDTVYRFASDGSNPTLYANTGDAPYGLAFDSGGNLFVANYTANTIEKFTSLNNGSVFASTDLLNPTSIAVSPVPEPSSYAALAGMAALGFAAWRKRKILLPARDA